MINLLRSRTATTTTSMESSFFQQHLLQQHPRFIISALLPRACRPGVAPAGSRFSNPKKRLTRIGKLKKGKVIPEIHDFLTARLIGKPQSKAMRQMFWFRTKHRKYAPVFAGQLRPKMNLVARALVDEDLPPPNLPEVSVLTVFRV